jgi:uncharacterized protein (DUF1778 family)
VVIIMAATKQERRLREERLGFRVDEPTKALIERAAQLERRKLTDFCMTALPEAAGRTIAEHESVVLSDRDRAVFFDTLVNPPVPNERLQRAFAGSKSERVSGSGGSKRTRNADMPYSEFTRSLEAVGSDSFRALPMLKVAASPLRHASCCFPHASLVSQTGAGKQKTAPRDDNRGKSVGSAAGQAYRVRPLT